MLLSGNKLNKKPTQEQLKLLLRYYQTGKFNDAEKLAISVTKKFPDHHFAWKVLGTVLSQSGRQSEALNFLQKSVILFPQDTGSHNILGVTLKELGKLEEAETSFKQAIALKEDFAEAHSNLGITLKELGRLEEAEASYKQAIALKPDFAIAHNNLGNVLKELERLEEAEASYKQAIALKADFTLAYSNLGVTYMQLGKLEEAEASYKQAIALKADFAEAHNNLGVTLKKLHRLEEAEASYKQAIALKPDFAEAHNNLGSALRELGRLKDAEISFKKAIAVKPDYGEARHMLAALTGETTATAPRDYVENIFDNYAARFENSLVKDLEYKTPKSIAEIIVKDSKVELLGSILDLGCGTGLFGLEIKEFCQHLEGIDLSKKMLREAKKKNIYNKLIREDIVVYLSKANLNFDYFVFVDVFIYIGDLSEILRLIKNRNKKGGKIVFSTEEYNGTGYFLEQSGRYSHSKKYIESLCKKFDYKLSHFEIQNIRKEKNHFITGGLYLLDF